MLAPYFLSVCCFFGGTHSPGFSLASRCWFPTSIFFLINDCILQGAATSKKVSKRPFLYFAKTLSKCSSSAYKNCTISRSCFVWLSSFTTWTLLDAIKLSTAFHSTAVLHCVVAVLRVVLPFIELPMECRERLICLETLPSHLFFSFQTAINGPSSVTNVGLQGDTVLATIS